MAKFRWHTLDKKERDPGWADERPEPTGPVIEPRSPFRSRRTGRPIQTSGWISGSATGRLTKLTPKRGKRKKAGKGTVKTGATTPFDYYSLGTASEIAKARATKRAKKAKKPEKPEKLSRQNVTAAGTQPAPKPKRRRKSKAVATAPAPSTKQLPVVEVLPASMGRITREAVTLSWRKHPDVVRWKVTCSDEAGQVLRKAGLASEVLSVTIGGLDGVNGQLLLRVRGHNSLGQLVCEGVLSGVSLKPR